jgi:hypothetical protein
MGLRPSFPILALLATTSLVACVQDTPTGAADPAASLAMTATATPILVEGVGFELPESAAYDMHDDVYLLSNVGMPAGDDSPFAHTNNGFISRLAPDGSVLALRWIEGTAAHPLHSPTGILVVGDVLHVVDREAVKHYDRATGAWLGATPLPATAMLPNDICVGNRGDLYVTDMGFGLDLMPAGGDAIYRIRDGVVTTFAAGAWLAFPNGCTTNGANVIVTSFDEPSTRPRLHPPERGVGPSRASSSSCGPAPRPPALQHVDAVRVAHVESRCAIAMVVRSRARCSSARWIAASVSLSTALVASSSTSTGGSLRIARAIATRCRCPPESFCPRSPTMVS